MLYDQHIIVNTCCGAAATSDLDLPGRASGDMVQFDSRFSAVMYGEALLAGVNTKDSKIAKISAALQRETLEQMHIILADPQARAVLRLKLLVKRQPSLTHERRHM